MRNEAIRSRWKSIHMEGRATAKSLRCQQCWQVQGTAGRCPWPELGEEWHEVAGAGGIRGASAGRLMAVSVDDQLFLEHISPIVTHHHLLLHHPHNEVFRGPGGENVACYRKLCWVNYRITEFLTVTVFHATALLTGAHLTTEHSQRL